MPSLTMPLRELLTGAYIGNLTFVLVSVHTMYIYSQSILLRSCNSTIAHRLVNRIDGSVSSLTISFAPDCTEQGHIFVQCCCAVATNTNSLNGCVYFTPLADLPRFFLSSIGHLTHWIWGRLDSRHKGHHKGLLWLDLRRPVWIATTSELCSIEL